MRYNKLFLMGMLLLAMVVGCSSDDHENDNENIDMAFSIFSKSTIDGANSYNKDDEITFQLSVSTYKNLKLVENLNSGDIILDNNFFSVYSEDGKIVSAPKKEDLNIEVLETTHGPYVFSYVWNKSSFMAGNYYTKFSVKYNMGVESGKDNFGIKTFYVPFTIK